MDRLEHRETYPKRPEERYAYYRQCHVFRKGGEQCKAPAEKGAHICHAHAGRQVTALRRERERRAVLAEVVQRGTALLTTPKTAARARENFDISTLPENALDEINRIQTRQRLNEVVKIGIPGFIPQGR